MKSPLKKSIGEVVTDYGLRVMKVFKKGLLQRSLFDFYGDIKADALRTRNLSSVPSTPLDKEGGVTYTKSSDGKLYYKSNEVAEVELSAHTATQSLSVKILPSDFVADDSGRPAQIDDASGGRWLFSHSTSPLFACVEIPLGFKATHVHIYGNGTSAITVSEAGIDTRIISSKGTGSIGTSLNITDVTATPTNYILIELAQTTSEQVHGGTMTIAAV